MVPVSASLMSRSPGRIVIDAERRRRDGRPRDKDALAEEFRVAGGRPSCERVSEEAHAQVGVLLPGARCTRSGVAGEEAFEVCNGVVGERVPRIRWCGVGRH